MFKLFKALLRLTERETNSLDFMVKGLEGSDF